MYTPALYNTLKIMEIYHCHYFWKLKMGFCTCRVCILLPKESLTAWNIASKISEKSMENSWTEQFYKGIKWMTRQWRQYCKGCFYVQNSHL
jgi:hypothetical protein